MELKDIFSSFGVMSAQREGSHMPLVTQSIPKIRAHISPGSCAHLPDRACIHGVLTSVSDSEHPHRPPVGNLFALDQGCWCIQLRPHIPLSLNIS